MDGVGKGWRMGRRASVGVLPMMSQAVTPHAPKTESKLPKFPKPGGFFRSRRRSNSVTELMIRGTMNKLNFKKDHGKQTFEVLATMPDGETRTLKGEYGMRIIDLVADSVMEHKLDSYRVRMSATKALLNLDADASIIQNEGIEIEDGADDEPRDPRLASDPRLRIAYQILNTERSYQESLKSIFDIYAEPLRKFSSLSKEDHRILFFGLEALLSLSAMLCLKLDDAIQNWDSASTGLGKVFSKQFWNHYDEYYFGYNSTRQLLKEKRETDEEFVTFCRIRRGAARHSLESLLLLPVQRIPAYDEYLYELLAKTEEGHPDHEDLAKAASRVRKMVKERESDITQVENDYKVESVQERFPNDDLQLQERENIVLQQKTKSLLSRRRSAPSAVILKAPGKSKTLNSPPGSVSLCGSHTLPDFSRAQCVDRVYILEGPVQLTVGVQTQERYLFLFNDLMLIAKPRSSNSSQFKLKHRIRVSEMWTANCLDDVSETTRAPDKSFVMGWPTTNMVATFKDPEIKESWLSKLQEQIASEKDKDVPRTVSIKVLNNDMESYARSKCVTISNMEDAHDVVKRCIEEFSITEGNAEDYQLWVTFSNKDEAPYPLIGHEHPYAIKMSHIRNFRDGRQEFLLPMDVDSNDNTIPCQFVLRQKQKIGNKLLEESSSKKSKRSRNLMSLFRKSSKHMDPSPPMTPTAGKLFGQDLSDVMEDDTIPKPIMRMLEHLYVEGPYTKGIFRVSANQRVCKEVRSKMDNDEDVRFDEIGTVVTGACLKDFLRSLPTSLLDSTLSKEWMETLCIEDEEERLHKVQKVVEKLPLAHRKVLFHLLAVLARIHEQSQRNNMNASNLSICIGPTLFWAPGSGSAPASVSDTMDKIPILIQYLILHHMDIFGEGLVLEFGSIGTHKPRQDSGTDSDSLHSIRSLPDATSLVLREDSPVDSGIILTDSSYQSHEEKGKQSLTRSISNFEESAAGTQDPGKLSRSLDCSLDEPPPIPPPRKHRHRMPDGPKLSPSDWHSHSYLSKRISCDSLGSLEEYSETSPTESQNAIYAMSERLRGSSGDAIIHRSESGARIFLNDELVHQTKKQTLELPPNLQSPQQINHRSYHASVKGKKEQPVPETMWEDHRACELDRRISEQTQQGMEQDRRGSELERRSSVPVKVLQSSWHDDDRNTVMRKVRRGMTPDGADLFPKHAFKTIRASVNQLRQQQGVEKSASDTRIFPEEAVMHPTEQWRPEKPPSYSEAMQRKSQLQGNVSEQDRLQQTLNSARARQLYEESMKKYQEASSKPEEEGLQSASSESTPNGSHESTPKREGSASEATARDSHRAYAVRQPMSIDSRESTPIAQPDTAVIDSPHMDKQHSITSPRREIPPNSREAAHRGSREGTPMKDMRSSREGTPMKDMRSPREGTPMNDMRSPREGSPMKDMRSPREGSPMKDMRSPREGMPMNDIRSPREGTPMKDMRSPREGTPMNDMRSPREGTPMKDMRSPREGTPMKDTRSSREGTPIKENVRGSREGTPMKEITSQNVRHLDKRRESRERTRSRERHRGQRLSDTRLDRCCSVGERTNLSRSKSDSSEHLNKLRQLCALTDWDSKPLVRRTSVDSSMERTRPRRAGNSVRNRNWHKELSEQYSQTFFQPQKEKDSANTCPVYYSAPPRQEPVDGEKPRRRWQPPVHPTKDLIVNRSSNKPSPRTQSNRDVHRNALPQRSGSYHGNGDRHGSGNVHRNVSETDSEKENKPAKYTVTEVPRQESPVSEQTETEDDIDKTGLSWSVASLRNLYDQRPQPETPSDNSGARQGSGERPPPPPYRHPPPVTRSNSARTTRDSRSHSNRQGAQKTSPHAEESYV